MSCGKTFLYLKKYSNGVHSFAFVPSRCKSWSCPVCRPIKARIVRNFVNENFSGDNLHFVTLTFFHSGSVLDCWNTLGEKWNRMRTYIVKKYGPFSYLRIVEPHKKGGWPHLHVLIDGNLIRPDVGKKVTDWGFGWNLHSVRITAKDAADYLSKYLTKEWPGTSPEVYRQASKTRIVSVSRDLPGVFTKKSEWEVVQFQLADDPTKWACNVFISMLKQEDASFILCKPTCSGFIIESDIEIKESWLEAWPDQYVWEYCKYSDYEFLPYGLQMAMNLLI